MDELDIETFALRRNAQIEREHHAALAEGDSSLWELQAEMLYAQQRKQTGRSKVKMYGGISRTLEAAKADPMRHSYHAETTGWRRTSFPDGFAADYYWRDGRPTGLWMLVLRSGLADRFWSDVRPTGLWMLALASRPRR